MKLKNELDKICACNDQLAECHWKMIADFEHPNVFIFEEVCHLWVSMFIFPTFACIWLLHCDVLYSTYLKYIDLWVI